MFCPLKGDYNPIDSPGHLVLPALVRATRAQPPGPSKGLAESLCFRVSEGRRVKVLRGFGRLGFRALGG